MSNNELEKLLEYIKSDKYLSSMLDALLVVNDRQAFIRDALPYLLKLATQYNQPPACEPRVED